MDEQRLDTLARQINASRTRRSLLGSALLSLGVAPLLVAGRSATPKQGVPSVRSAVGANAASAAPGAGTKG